MSVLAHQTWFVHHPEDYPVGLGALTRPVVLAGLMAVVLVAVAWRVVAGRVGPVELRALRPLGALAPWVPRLLAVHLGLSLVVLTWTRSLLDPSVAAPDGWAGTLLLAPQAVVGALLVAGVLVRLAAWLVVLAGPVLLVLEGPLSLLMCLVLLGIAGFLVLVPPDPARTGRADLHPARLRPALLVLRLGAAGSLLVLAVVEKLANPAMGEAMLSQEPVLNLLSPLGMSPAAFVVLAGCVEVLFALLVLSGAAPQVVALVAAVPFTASLALFGGTELIGHLPVYGVLLTLLVLGSGTRTAPQVRALTLSRGARD
ncbi:hypothetical protein BH24ACT10_BH24ACT10_09050 [soil metagenome]